MEEVHIADKAAYLKEHYPFGDVPDMDEMVDCLHCQRSVRMGDYKGTAAPMASTTYVAPMPLNAMAG